jgi:outer membrane receptor for ferrienterochelin and colicins
MDRQNKLSRIAFAVAVAFGISFTAVAEDSDEDVMVVSASGFAQNIKEAPASISVITRQDLEGKSFHNIADAVKDIEGISVDRGGKAGGMNISIRGMGSDYTLILIDGKRMSSGGEASRPNGFRDVDTNFIPPLSAIERIEVIRGPMSTLYGSDAMGGVINIITRRVNKEWTGKIESNVTLQEESKFGDTYGSSLYLSGPLKDELLGLTLRGNVYHRDNHDIYYDNGTGQRTKMGFSGLGQEQDYSIGAKLTLTPNIHNDIIFDVESARLRYNNNENQLGTQNSTVRPGRAGGGYADRMRFERDKFSLSHAGIWDWGNSDNSVMYDTTKTIGRLNPKSNPADPDDGKDRDIKYSTLTFDSKWSVPMFDEANQITFGGQYWQQKLTDTLSRKPKNHFEQYQWALFAEDKWQIIDTLALTTGIRYDKNEVFGDHWSPRGYLVWNALPELTFKGGVSQGYKTPDLNKMIQTTYNYGRQGQLPLVGNPDLKPETSTTSELGVIFDNNRDFSTSLTAFHTEYKNKIASKSYGNCEYTGGPVTMPCMNVGVGPDFKDISRVENVDRAEIRGLEFGVKYRFSPAWRLSANYTLTDSEQKSGTSSLDGKGHPINNVARHIVNAKAQWQAMDNVDVWLSGQYRGKQYAGLLVDAAGTKTDKEMFYKSYVLVDAGANYKVTKNVTLSATVYNVGNKNFVDYGPNEQDLSATAYSNRYAQVLEGRRYYLSAEYSF